MIYLSVKLISGILAACVVAFVAALTALVWAVGMLIQLVVWASIAVFLYFSDGERKKFNINWKFLKFRKKKKLEPTPMAPKTRWVVHNDVKL